MSTDRELLELAAKAAGIKAKWFRVTKWKDTGTSKIRTGKAEVFGTHHSKPWNPLTDDGDALRLAAALHIDMQHDPEVCEVSAQYVRNRVGYFVNEEYAEGGCLTALRRAIVRAAAEIGRSMP